MGAVNAATVDRLIEGQGTPEAQWQAWPGLQALAPIDLDTLVPGGRRAVVVSPHPDDEVLAFGGLLALLCARGDEPLVLAVTDGEASHPGSAEWPRAALAARRIHESCEGLRQLGLAADRRLGLKINDGQVTAQRDRLLGKLLALLQPGDVVLSTWALDGHPDHEASADAVAIACQRLGCQHLQAPVWMWHWAQPGDVRVPWAQMRQLVLPAPVVAQKHRAIHAHVTQLNVQDTGTPAVLPDWALARLLRPFEVFILPDAPVGPTP